MIGGGNVINRPNYGGNVISNINNNNIFQNNQTIINNQNNWGGGWGLGSGIWTGGGWGNPGWGGGGWGWNNRPWLGGNWGGYWANRYINPYHGGWYHGAWNTNWATGAYVPLVYGATAWGLGALSTGWGYSYGASYANPYYSPQAIAFYDYSQPIVMQTYVLPEDSGVALAGAAVDPQVAGAVAEAPPALDPAHEQGYALFDQARTAFAAGQYQQALDLVEQAIGQVPDDPILHEFGGLALFALGDYNRSAAVLNALLAVAPGMDWTTMSSLYGSAGSEAYTEQLRRLEAHCQGQPNDPAARFVLAYHYLVAGHAEAAAEQLRAVVKLQPTDRVAQRILDALTPPEQPAPAALAEAGPVEAPPVAPPPARPDAPPAQVAEAAPDEPPPGPTTDLVGLWRAERDGNSFELKLEEAGGFTWKAAPKGQTEVSVSGEFGIAGDNLIMESAEQGTMFAAVTSIGEDEFRFVPAGSPPDDPGLTFRRVEG